jgi:hypothetical protein
LRISKKIFSTVADVAGVAGPDADGPDADGPDADGPDADGPDADGPDARYGIGGIVALDGPGSTGVGAVLIAVPVEMIEPLVATLSLSANPAVGASLPGSSLPGSPLPVPAMSVPAMSVPLLSVPPSPEPALVPAPALKSSALN